jgi:hypothetical protein
MRKQGAVDEENYLMRSFLFYTLQKSDSLSVRYYCGKGKIGGIRNMHGEDIQKFGLKT